MKAESTLKMLQLDMRGRGLSPKTFAEYSRILRPLLEQIERVDDLDRTTVTEWVYEGKSDSSKRHRWLAVKALVRMLMTEDMLTSDPCSKLPMPKDVAPPQPSMSEASYDALVASCERGFIGRRDRAIITLFGSTGARRTELATLRVEDVDIDAGTITIVKGKGGKSRRSYMDPASIKAMASWLQTRQGFPEERLWITTTGKPLAAEGVRQMIERRAEKLGLPHITPHQFRRRMAERWLLQGGSESALMNTAGWTSPTMPSRYAQASLEQIAHAEHTRLFGS